MKIQTQCELLQMVVICTQCLLSIPPCEPSPLTSDQGKVKLWGKPKYPVCTHEGWIVRPFLFRPHTPECITKRKKKKTSSDGHERTIISSVIRLHVNRLKIDNSSASKTWAPSAFHSCNICHKNDRKTQSSLSFGCVFIVTWQEGGDLIPVLCNILQYIGIL